VTGKLSAAQQPNEAKVGCPDFYGELCTKAHFSVAPLELGCYSRGDFVSMSPEVINWEFSRL